MVYAFTCLQKYTRVTLHFTKHDNYNIVAYTYCVHFIIIQFSVKITINYNVLIILINCVFTEYMKKILDEATTSIG